MVEEGYVEVLRRGTRTMPVAGAEKWRRTKPVCRTAFFEVCGGSEILTRGVQSEGLPVTEGATLPKVNLCTRAGFAEVRNRIENDGPYITHFSPECRIGSQRFELNLRHDPWQDPEFLE